MLDLSALQWQAPASVSCALAYIAIICTAILLIQILGRRP